MPCYDPPPPWEGAARRSAEQAANLLCRLVKGLISDGQVPPRPLLEWYIGHHKVDLRMLLEPHYRAHGSPSEIDGVQQSIAHAESLLARTTGDGAL